MAEFDKEYCEMVSRHWSQLVQYGEEYANQIDSAVRLLQYHYEQKVELSQQEVAEMLQRIFSSAKKQRELVQQVAEEHRAYLDGDGDD